MQQLSQLEGDPYMIRLENCHSDNNKGHCGYCGKDGSCQVGLACNLMKASTYKSLMDQGWRRCGDYYYRPSIQKSCCSSYSIRMEANQYQIKKSHKKQLDKFEKLLNAPGKFNEETKEEQKQEVKHDTDTQQDTFIIVQDTENIELLKSSLSKFIEQIDLNIFQQILDYKNLETNKFLFQKDIFVQKSKNIKKGSFYSNYWQILYGNNIKILNNMKKEQFFLQTQKYLTEGLNQLQDKYICVLEQNGIISFVDKENQNILQKKVIKSEKPKQQQPKTTNSDQKKDLEPKQLDVFRPNMIKKGKLTIIFDKAKLTKPNYQLYKKYCETIHNKKKESEKDFQNFLCLQALEYDTLTSDDCTMKMGIGCYHMNYFIDGKFVAVGVVDIFPDTMSSVYFFYDPDYKKHNLGTISSIIEIQWVQNMSKLFKSMKYYYLGYFIQNCVKMSYKGDFEPCYLLCPDTYTWVLLTKELRKQLEKDVETKQNNKIIRLANEDVKPDSRILSAENKALKKYLENNTQMSIYNKSLSFQEVSKQFRQVDLYKVFGGIAKGIFRDLYKSMHFGYNK